MALAAARTRCLRSPGFLELVVWELHRRRRWSVSVLAVALVAAALFLASVVALALAFSALSAVLLQGPRLGTHP